MRKQSLLLGAAMVAASVITCKAQTNITITLQPGYNLITCPLQNSDPTSSINSVLTNINPTPQYCFVQTFNPTAQRYNPAVLSGGDGHWYDQSYSYQVTNSLPPGMGFFYYNGDGVTETATITGTVLTGTNSITIYSGYGLYGQFEPVVGDICTNNFPVVTYSTLNYWAGNYWDNSVVGISPADNGTEYPMFTTGDFQTAVVAPAIGQGFLYYNQDNNNDTWTQIYPAN